MSKTRKTLKILLFPVLTLLFFIILFKNKVIADYDPNWGVLALNTDKSVYKVGDKGNIFFGVLDAKGDMICDAQLELKISGPDSTDILSTQNNSIVVNPDCSNKKAHENPDYVAEYKFTSEGIFNLQLRAQTKAGEYSISKKVKVENTPLFDIQRKTHTRIYPKNSYEVELVVTSSKDFHGTFTEYIPGNFEISESRLFSTAKESHKQKLLWNVAWSKNETYYLKYKYKAPEKSPEYYELGPYQISNSPSLFQKIFNLNTLEFEEFSTWQIASDDFLDRYTTSCTSTGPKTWSNVTNPYTLDLGSTAALSSFSTANSAVGLISDEPILDCSGFNARDLGAFNSADILFSFATEGSNNGDDYIDFNYTISGTQYDLTTITQAPNTGQSNATNNNYWRFPATNITSWADIGNTTINVEGVKVTRPDRNNAYLDALWIEVDYTPRTYTQNDFEWYAPEGTVTLTNIWPTGGGDNLAENTALTQFPATNEPLTSGDQIRLQMNFTVGGANLPATTESFNLEYAAGEDCTTATGWQTVGAKASGTIWRLYDETSLADSVTQVNQISTSDSGTEGYFSEIISTSNNPNAVNTTQTTEWDWPLENNGAADNTSYCFRMVLFDGSGFDTYNADSYPKLTTAPGTSDQMRHGKIFQNSIERGFFWAN